MIQLSRKFCDEALRGEVCVCPDVLPPLVTPPANPTVQRFALVDGRLQPVEVIR